MPTTPVPPVPPWPTPPGPPTGPDRGRRGIAGWVLAVAVVGALVVGGVAGYLAGVPSRNALSDDKEAVEAELATTQATLDQVRRDLEDTQTDLEAAGLAADAAEACRTAADDADALITAWADLAADIDAWWVTEAGSVEEEQLGLEIERQLTEIEDQDEAVQAALEECRSAIRVA
jgi:hypothetical protein